VDDNATNRLILAEQLGRWGLAPQLADDGAAALDLLHRAAARGRPFPLALLDMTMPGLDGLELARRVGDEPALAGTRLVLLTSTDVTPHQLEGVELAAYLNKPVRSAQLHACLAEVLRPVLEAASPVGPAAGAPAAAGRGRVLVVEDNVINQLVALGLLDRLGFECDLAGNGREALAALDRCDYAAVLMDCQMPEMDGYTATGELRRREGAARHTPVIAMTAGALAGDEDRCLAAGMDAYVPKPIDSTMLQEVLDRWVPDRSQP
jgi:CheY-like chemotaxis protein